MSTILTLKYGKGRRSCLEGYLDEPHFHQGVALDLPPFFQVSRRVVQFADRRLLFWSPNSTQTPFLPGVPPLGFPRYPPLNYCYRRYDGSYGRFDPCTNPQFLDADRHHWPFIRRESRVLKDDDHYVLFQPLTNYWRDYQGPSSGRGRFEPAFVRRVELLGYRLKTRMESLSSLANNDPCTSANHPTVDMERIRYLHEVQNWGDAVDRGTAVQRKLRQAEAWLAWRAAQSRLDNDATIGTGMSIPPADDSFMGCWINGAPENMVRSFLAAGIPCFIVQELGDEEEIEGVRTHTSPIGGTEIAVRLSDANPYQAIARRERLRDTQFCTWPGQGEPRPTSEIERKRASLAYQRGLHRVRMPWIEPPPVQEASASGKWAQYELDNIHGMTSWIYRDEHSSVDSSTIWYDRVNKRRLYMRSYSIPPGVLDHETFGAPVPPYSFWSSSDGGWRYIKQKPSRWMYPTANPLCHDVGRQALHPHVDRLPWLPGYQPPERVAIAAGEVEEDSRRDKSKGKAVALSNEDEDDWVCAEAGDAPPPQGIPSEVVVLDNVAEALSAVSFSVATGPSLLSISVTPVEIARARGRMWLRFVSVEEGVQAMGVLARSNLSQRNDVMQAAFATRADFDDAWLYSQDRWGLDTLDPLTGPSPALPPLQPLVVSETTLPSPPLPSDVLSPPSPGVTVSPTASFGSTSWPPLERSIASEQTSSRHGGSSPPPSLLDGLSEVTLGGESSTELPPSLLSQLSEGLLGTGHMEPSIQSPSRLLARHTDDRSPTLAACLTHSSPGSAKRLRDPSQKDWISDDNDPLTKRRRLSEHLADPATVTPRKKIQRDFHIRYNK